MVIGNCGVDHGHTTADIDTPTFTARAGIGVERTPPNGCISQIVHPPAANRRGIAAEGTIGHDKTTGVINAPSFIRHIVGDDTMCDAHTSAGMVKPAARRCAVAGEVAIGHGEQGARVPDAAAVTQKTASADREMFNKYKTR